MIPRRELIENLRAYARVSLLHRSGLGREHDDRVLDLMMACVGRILVKMSLSSKEDEIDGMDDVKVAHIRDWVSAAVVNDAPWLKNLDEEGRPRKLLKFPTIDAIVAEVDRDMLLMAEKYGKITDLEGDVEIHTALSGGFNVVRMLTPRALDRESAAMQHCVGDGAYDAHLDHGDVLLLSLRDRHGNPHATFQVWDGSIREISGKQNKPPVARYHTPISEFLQKNPDLKVPCGDGRSGFIVDRDRNFHDLLDLPSVLRRNGDLHLVPDNNMLDKLRTPKSIESTGSVNVKLDLYDDNIESIDCSRLSASGGLRSLGHDTLINRGMLSGTPLEFLSLSHMRDLTRIPEELRCAGSVILKDTGLTEFPVSLFGNNETAPRSITLASPLFKTLGKLKAVEGTLELKNCTEFELPDGFRAERIEVSRSKLLVGGKLWLVPRGNRQITGRVGGLYVDASSIRFEKETEFSGEVGLINSEVEFGSSFSAHKLRLSGSKVSKMPEELICRSELVMRGTQLDHWPRKMTAGIVVMNGSEIDRIEGEARIGELSVIVGTMMDFGPDVRIDRVVFRSTNGADRISLPFMQAVRYLGSPGRFQSLEDLVHDTEFRPTEPYRISDDGVFRTARGTNARDAA